MKVTINGKDARGTWGIVFDSSAVSALMTPPPMKDYIADESRLEHGRRVIASNAKVDRRDVTLTLALYARSETAFYSRLNAFCTELEGARLDIELGDLPGTVYKCVYRSCSQFTQYNGRLAKFSLKLEEPNPKDRTPDAAKTATAPGGNCGSSQ